MTSKIGSILLRYLNSEIQKVTLPIKFLMNIRMILGNSFSFLYLIFNIVYSLIGYIKFNI